MKSRLLSVLALACLGGSATVVHAAYGFFGTNGSFAIINSNGTGNTYFHLDSGANAAFDGTFFGTFNTLLGDTLVLNGGEVQTYENSGDSVTDPASLFYRVYETGSPAGSFTGITLGNLSFPGSPGDEKRDNTSANVNLLSALPDGNYTLEVYASAAVDWNGQLGGAAEDTIYASNGGSNYKATFSIIPEPSIPVLAALGLGTLFARRRKA